MTAQPENAPHWLVLGAGVMGLTVAWKLLQAGVRPTLWAAEPTLASTSAVAAAVWYPFEAEPAERVARWALASLPWFAALADQPESGVAWLSALDLAPQERESPTWLTRLPGARVLTGDELPEGMRSGWRLEVPRVDMTRYLPWLLARLEDRGVGPLERRVENLEDLGGFDAVVNCTGLGSRELFGDRELFPIRGQIVVVPRGELTHIQLFTTVDGELGYVIPRTRDCVLGGTTEHGRESLVPDLDESERILERCLAREPGIVRSGSRVNRVGLRPGRSEVRLEEEVLSTGLRLIHNYGHGGCGVTVSPACADEVLGLLGLPQAPASR